MTGRVLTMETCAAAPADMGILLFNGHIVDQHIMQPVLGKLSIIIEMLYYVKLRCFQLPLLNSEKVSIIVNHICTERYYLVGYFVYDFIITILAFKLLTYF